MNKKQSYLEETLREAMQKSGMNSNQLEEISGVSNAIICRFLNRERTMTLPTASKLVEALGLELKPKRKKKRQVKK